MNETSTRTYRAEQDVATAAYAPQLAIYHANKNGTGCAMKMELHPARGGEDGCFMLILANQMTVGEGSGAARTFSKFNWERRITVKLDFSDICRIMQVLRGETESIDDGRGLFHDSGRYQTRLVLRHIVTPVQAYSLEVYRNSKSGCDDASSHIILSSSEAYGVFTALEHSIAFICFGVPGAYGAAGVKNVSAA